MGSSRISDERTADDRTLGPTKESEGASRAATVVGADLPANALLRLQRQIGNRAVTAMLGAPPNGEAAQLRRVFVFRGIQYHSVREISARGADAAYAAYRDNASPDKRTKLDDTARVYNLATATLDAVADPVEVRAAQAPAVAPAPVPTGQSRQALAAAATRAEMTRLQPLVRAAAVSFRGDRAAAHMPSGATGLPPLPTGTVGDGTANLADVAAVTAVIRAATAANMEPGTGAGNIRLTYGAGASSRGLSVVFTFNEIGGQASIFHIGPGG